MLGDFSPRNQAQCHRDEAAPAVQIGLERSRGFHHQNKSAQKILHRVLAPQIA